MSSSPLDLLDQLEASLPSEGDCPSPSRHQIKKINYSHDGMINMILANRGISQNTLAAAFGYSPSWISTVMQSDAFQDRLRARAAELEDPTLVATIEDGLRGVLARSMELLKEKLDAPSPPDNLVLRSIELSTRALGLGIKPPVVVQNNMEVHLDNLGSRLEGLLARKKAEANDQPLLESPT